MLSTFRVFRKYQPLSLLQPLYRVPLPQPPTLFFTRPEVKQELPSRSQMLLMQLGYRCRILLHQQGLQPQDEHSMILLQQLLTHVKVIKCRSTNQWGSSTVYLVGVFHRSLRSRILVTGVIRWLESKVLLLELCSERRRSIMRVLTSEFRVAKEEGERYGAELVMADQPYSVTQRRIAEELLTDPEKSAEWDAWNAALVPSYAEEDPERVTNHMEEKYPNVVKIFHHERNSFMVNKLLTKVPEYRTAIMIVGAAHMLGIRKLLDDYRVDKED